MTNSLFGSISDTSKWIYHYTSRETALEYIFTSGKIQLNTFANLNDPRESKDWSFSLSVPDDVEIDSEEFFDIQRQGTNYAKNHCKILCMVQDDPRAVANGPDYMFHRGFSRPRMWAQYSGNHTGVCLIFDRAKLEETIKLELTAKGDIYFGEVQYVSLHPDEVDAFNLSYEEIFDTSLDATIDSKIKKYYKNYYFSKVEDWSNENEWRCILRGNSTMPEYVSISDSICGIVLGGDFPSVYEPAITPFGVEFSVNIGRIAWRNGQPVILPGPQPA